MTTVKPNVRRLRHGGTYEQLYRVWEAMVARCHKPGSSSYENYGARGIRVCDRWRFSYANFRLDMGLRPGPGLSIDRRDNDGDYEPGNCRWATRVTQQNNTQKTRWLSHEGKTQSVAAWAAELGVPASRIRDRLNKGVLTTREVLLNPPDQSKNNYKRN